jgi:hypothetical protein
MVSMNATSHPVMTQRKQRAAEIASREAELRERQGDLDRKRARATGERGQKRPVNDAERQLRSEMRALARERQVLLEQVSRREAQLRQRQSLGDRARAAAARKGRQPSVTKAERALRAELAVLESERAHLDGTAQRIRQDADIRDATW